MVMNRDWESFYRLMAGRATRPLFDRALATWGDRAPGQAVDLGAGDGTETLALLERGWSVVAVDADPGSARIIEERVPPADRERLQIRTASTHVVQLPDADLIYAGFSLPFLLPTDFRIAWSNIKNALREDGIVAVNVFGPHDTWHADPTMTFLERDAVVRLADGLELLWLEERDEDGEAISGPKHWHVFDLIARRRAEAP